MEYATYRAMTDNEKTALIAWSPAKTRRPMISAPMASNHTVLTGVLVYVFIRYSQLENGSAGEQHVSQPIKDVYYGSTDLDHD